jgi:hypothetical protein
MFKVLVLQTLYTLSDNATEYQLRNWISFMGFGIVRCVGTAMPPPPSRPPSATPWAGRWAPSSYGIHQDDRVKHQQKINNRHKSVDLEEIAPRDSLLYRLPK